MEQLKYAYYPGCTRETTGLEYDASLREVFRVLEIDLQEIPGWNCCGASSGHATDYWLSHGLAGRNLALAEKMNMDIAVACPACFLRLKSTLHEFKYNPVLSQELPDIINIPYSGRYGVHHILEILGSLQEDVLKTKVKRPLSGLRVVAYYGCYLIRPPELTGFDDPENPQIMDNLLEKLGADVSDWRGKVSCCGGSQSFTLRNEVIRLVSSITEAAREVEAAAIVTACPLCQVNLETRQNIKEPIPIFYFTELMGIAFGIPSGNWLRRHLINPYRVISKYI